MRPKFSWGWLVLLGWFVLPKAGMAQPVSEVTEGDLKLEHGQVNWTNRTVIATGSGAPDLKAPNVAAARLGAERVAKMDALRNILETIKGVRLNSEITVEKQMITSSKMRSKVEGVAGRFKVLKTKYYSDGGVDLVVQMSLDGPLGITLVQPGNKAQELSSSGKVKHTGLILDTRGLRAFPALAPKIVDESGRTIYSSEYLESQALEEHGVASYFRDIQAAKTHKRVGANPLVLKAIRLAQGSKTDVMLSDSDAEKLRDPKANLKYLAEGRVVIVVD